MLKVWTNGVDDVVAESPEDADRVLDETYGKGHGIEAKWAVVPDDKALSIHVEIDDIPTWATLEECNDLEVTRQCSELVERYGRGHLCSSEY